MKNNFGSYIRACRINAGIGQRELARKIGVSPSYLNDIEHSKRPSPSANFLSKMQDFLPTDVEKLNDLAGKTKNGLPPDVERYLSENIASISLVRILQNLKFTDKKILELRNMVTSQNYKAIIIAAGLGSRLEELTKNIPKCMLELNGKSILQHQIDSFQANGISDISVVRGYKKEKINIENLTYYENLDYKNNNILNSLFYAEPKIVGNVIVSYSDIVFNSKIVNRLLESNADISIVVDVDWRGRYVSRADHPIEEAENVIFDANHSVVDIGKIITKSDDVHGEFIGMIKFTPRGAEIFKRHYHRAKELFWDKPYQRAVTFQKAYLTDILKDMSELGVHIQTVIIEQGWQEIDTIEDFKNAQRNFQ
jgi:L-glutamine-phosphate cytidylyltransferase